MKSVKHVILFAFLVILAINPANGQDSDSAENLLKIADDHKTKSK